MSTVTDNYNSEGGTLKISDFSCKKEKQSSLFIKIVMLFWRIAGKDLFQLSITKISIMSIYMKL